MAERITFEQPRPVHRPGAAAVLVGVLRFGVALLLLIVGAVGVVLALLVPVRIGRARPAVWVAVGLARLVARVFAVRIVCSDKKAVRRHAGLIIINHLSYLDPAVVMALGPARFLSAAGVRAIPFIGWIARGIGTVFVNRGSVRSRAQSRTDLVEQLTEAPYPPVVIAPEGQIGPGDGVLPFRHGAFQIALDTGVSILPLALTYEPFEAAAWVHGEWIWRPLWRLAARTTPVTVTITALPVMHPISADAAETLAADAEARFNEVLKPVAP